MDPPIGLKDPAALDPIDEKALTRPIPDDITPESIHPHKRKSFPVQPSYSGATVTNVIRDSDAQGEDIFPPKKTVTFRRTPTWKSYLTESPHTFERDELKQDPKEKKGKEEDYDHLKPWNKYPLGYPRFSAFMASDEDKSTTIFRRFQRLSARNLLYLESELADLEHEQDEMDEESKWDPDLSRSMRSWNLLCIQATPRELLDGESEEEYDRFLYLRDAAAQRLHLAWRIREVLKTYHESLKRESEVLAFDGPDRRPLKGTRKIFGTGLKAAMLHGEMKSHLDNENEQDLCVLSPHVEQDRLTRLLEGRLSYFFRTRTDDGLSNFVSHKRVSIAVSIISGMLAILFLLGAVLGLYWVTNPNAKLGMLSGLTVGFAGSLALFTNARRQDVFASTAAYAAVLVVFISGNLGSDGGVSSSATTPTSGVFTSTITQFATVTASTITQFATVTAPATATAAGNSAAGGLSTNQKIGIGIGVPVAVASMAVCFYQLRKRA